MDSKVIFRAPISKQEWEKYYEFRWSVLRKPWRQPRGSERDELELTSHHLAAFTENGDIIGAGRIQFNKDAQLGVVAQIRYMAVKEGFRGQKIGATILQLLENITKENNISKIILNARENAIRFYSVNGYKIEGDAPTLYGAIAHVKMGKVIEEIK